MFDQTGRQVGVGVSEGQRLERSDEANVVKGFLPAEMFAIRYADDAGLLRSTVAMRINGEWFLPPNGEIWIASLRSLKPETWLAKRLTQLHLTQKTTVPKSDVVDILRGEPRDAR